VQEFKINYLDGTTQMVTSGHGPAVSGDWLVFTDGSGEVLRVRAAEVDSVGRPGIPERTGRTPAEVAR